MAIIAPQTITDGNFAVGDYWTILKSELLCGPGEPVKRWHYMLGFYASEYARDMSPQNPLWVEHIFVPLADIIAAGGVDPRPAMYAQIMQYRRFAGTNAASDAEVSPPKPLIPPDYDEPPPL